MARTKKVGAAGRFGTRYGTKIRARINKLHAERDTSCPACLRNSLKRESAGIWKCSKCGVKFAGKAYTR